MLADFVFYISVKSCLQGIFVREYLMAYGCISYRGEFPWVEIIIGGLQAISEFDLVRQIVFEIV